ncbi:unnamed protein product [Cladocopium goreaui]|uniref:Uncharacterized protein n=1 Tax=Cladocopium goreaui TaxID=2562237 RepID=A0A9P1FL38_9DINO|nr:unnamed protein product [Cladocopium goreaui]
MTEQALSRPNSTFWHEKRFSRTFVYSILVKDFGSSSRPSVMKHDRVDRVQFPDDSVTQWLDWKNFNQAKPVKKALKRVKSEEGFPGCKYYLYCNRNLKLTYQGLNQYHKAGVCRLSKWLRLQDLRTEVPSVLISNT